MAVKRAITDVWPHCVAVDSHADRLAFDKLDLGISDNSVLVPTTGDWPAVLYGIANKAYSSVAAMADADKPTALTIKRQTQIVNSGAWAGHQLVQITITAYSSAVTVPTDVAAEPT